MIRHCVTYRIIQHISPFTEHERVRRAVQLFDESPALLRLSNSIVAVRSCRSVSSINYARETSRNAHTAVNLAFETRVSHVESPTASPDQSNPIQSNPIASSRNRASRDNRPPPPSPPSSSRALDSDATHLWILSRAMFKRFQRPSRRPSRVSTSRASFPPHRRPRPDLARRLLDRRLPPTIVPLVPTRRRARRPGLPGSPRRRLRVLVARVRRHPARRGRLTRWIRSVARRTSQPYLNPI